MTKFLLINSTSINCKISTCSPNKYSLKSLKNYRLLNPYSFYDEYSKQNFIQGHTSEIKQNVHLNITGFILEYYGKDEIDYDLLFKYLFSFLNYLRFESKQVSIHPSVGIYAVTTVDKIIETRGAIDKISQMAIKTTHYKTMVTWANVIDADVKLFKQLALPVYEEMLLEAFNSYALNEYNKVLLFSTIAIESLLAQSYDGIYEKEKKKLNHNRKLRMVKYNTSTIKDPIWKTLMDRTDFKKLLHEAPLYLFNKSILLENEILYNNLIKLYNTRNKIVHWGAPIFHDPDKLIPLDSQGADLSIKMAIDVFNWVGIHNYNYILEKGFTMLNEAE